jgi:cyclohexyl-isocyanide hydratase
VIPENVHLNIGSLLFENLDQIDLTSPYEVLSNIPNATHRIYAKSTQPVRDVMGLRIMPDATLDEAPQLDILHVPGGPGQQALMENEEILGWLRSQAAGAKKVLSVCTGALICGAAGLIRGKKGDHALGVVPPLALVWRDPGGRAGRGRRRLDLRGRGHRGN